MSVYGAMNAAVSGLKAQSKSLGNISDNIANSQTVGFKRVDTSFSEMVTLSNRRSHAPGGVIATPRYRHSVQGDVGQTQIGTNMAISGAGFFVVSKANSVTPAGVSLDSEMLYTRRGDFEVDRFGFMKNGGGYYLRGRPVIDQTTLNVSDLLQPVRIQKDVMQAQQTSRIKYNLNLPANSATFSPRHAVDSQITQNTSAAQPQITTLTFGGTAITGDTVTLTLDDGDPLTLPTPVNFTYTGPTNNLNQFLDDLAAAITAAGAQDGGGNAITAARVNNTITLTGGNAGPFSVTVPAGAWNTPFTATTAVNMANADETLLYSASGSFSGGAVTVYNNLGAPVDVQFRWIKTDTPDQWQLLAKDPNAAPNAWTSAGMITFANGIPTAVPATMALALPASNFAGNITIDFTSDGENGMNSVGENGLTQFYAEDISVYRLDQDGYGAGVLSDVFINDFGFVVANYDNGRSKVLYQIPLATFNAPNELQRLDGGAFNRTPESGDPLYAVNGNAGAGLIIASATEGSNVDIADEFTKMIVTQRAYSANSKTVRTADDMLEEVINLKR
ncbi:flagellar hook-basal body complex protein [Caenispirillum bisanense]|uniref:flagellar hook protein FlgE n=1 Tax=Caenispirillum bisanense TaxID=414052 RepID=UPI0031E2E29C